MSEAVPYVRDLDFAYGEVAQVSPLIRRVIAHNPSVFTFHGTGTYIVGHGNVAIIDAGPDLAEHVDAVLAAVRGETVTHLVVTHTHIDHSPATRHIKAATGAPTYGFGPHGGGEGPAVEEGADRDFVPDHRIEDGGAIEGDGLDAGGRAHAWPHLEPPLLHVGRRSVALLRRSRDGMVDPRWSRHPMATWAPTWPRWRSSGRATRRPTGPRTGRRSRSRSASSESCSVIVASVRRKSCLPSRTARRPFPRLWPCATGGSTPRLRPAAARTVLAHLIHLVESGRAACPGAPDEDARYRAIA